MLSIFRSARRLISSSTAFEASTPASKQHVLYQVWGANTDVGKTILSAGLLRAVNQISLYVKPVQTGAPNTHDSILIDKVANLAKSCTLVSYDTPVSADLASELTDAQPIADSAIEHAILGTICRFEQHLLSTKLEGDTNFTVDAAFGLLETAGGVLSPLPSGKSQADFYRKFRLPGVLVGDAKLGGISGTLAAYESLRLRGFDVPAIVLFPQHEAIYENERAIERGVDLDYTTILRAPDLPPNEVELYKYFERDEVDSFFTQLLEHMRCFHAETGEKNALITAKAKDIVWYPFTQHKNLDSITCIDSAFGDRYKVYDDERGGFEDVIDAFGSWWTTGVGHGDARVARAIGYAAGRYGHVGLPNAIHDGAYEVAKRMLDGVGKGWASRVFFSDNGSTAIEVALKMAFRKQLTSGTDMKEWNDMKIVGCAGSYHGDTLGAMDCSAKSDFNSKQTPWYTPRGLFFEPPTVAIMDGVWKLRIPDEMDKSCDILGGYDGQFFRKRDDIYDEDRDGEMYDQYITQCMDAYEKDGNKLGALLLEPVMMGAGGMKLVDPAFQRALARIARQRGLVVIFDEVFSGLWRLGAESGAEILGVQPDIACYAKLLTGGTLPLAVTLATDEIFQAFVSDDIRDALLHGHSYTGHAIGCSAAVESLKMYAEQLSSSEGLVCYWDDSFVKELSCTEGVVSVSEMGTVLCVELEGESSGGYSATGSIEVQKRLLEQGVMTRPLGNVLYVMVPPLSEEETCKLLSDTLYRTILEWSQELDPNKSASRIA